MSESIREQIIKALINRMAVIQTANGFNTDCGLNVNRAVRNIDPDALPAVIVWPRKDENDPYYQQTGLSMPIDIEMYDIQSDSISPSEQSEQMLADVIEAVMGARWLVTFTGGNEEPTPGDTLTGNTSSAKMLYQSSTLSSGTWAGGDAEGAMTVRRKNGDFSSELVSIDGGSSDVMTIDGMIGTNSVELSAGGLAKAIYYAGGGTDTYPDSDNDTVAVQGNFVIVYHTADGDPYRVT